MLVTIVRESHKQSFELMYWFGLLEIRWCYAFNPYNERFYALSKGFSDEKASIKNFLDFSSEIGFKVLASKKHVYKFLTLSENLMICKPIKRNISNESTTILVCISVLSLWVDKKKCSFTMQFFIFYLQAWSFSTMTHNIFSLRKYHMQL